MAINDLWNKGKEVVVEGAKNLAKAGAEAARSTWGSAQRTMGLGAEATPGVTPEAETPRSTGNFEQRRADAAAKAQAEMQRNTLRGQQVQPWNTVTGQQFTPGNAAPSSGGSIVPRDPMLGPQQPAIDGVARNATNDGFGPSKGIDPNARGSAQVGLGATQPRPGFISRAAAGVTGAVSDQLGGYSKAAGVIGNGIGAVAKGGASLAYNVAKKAVPIARIANTVDQGSVVFDPTNDLTFRDRAKEAVRGGIRGLGIGLGGAVGGAIGTAAMPGVGTVAGGVGGAAVGYEGADRVAEWMLGAPKGRGIISKGVDYVAENWDKKPSEMGAGIFPPIRGHTPSPAKGEGFDQKAWDEMAAKAKAYDDAALDKAAKSLPRGSPGIAGGYLDESGRFREPRQPLSGNRGYYKIGNNPAVQIDGNNKDFSEPTARDWRATQLHAQGKSVYGMGNGLDESPGLRRPGSVVTSGTQGGVGGELGAMVGMVAKGMAEKNKYNAGVTQRNQELRTAQLQATLDQQKRAAEKDEGERINRRIEIEAANNIEPRKAGVAGIGGEKADEYNSRLDRAKKQLQGDIEFTVSNRKGGDAKNVEQLSRAEQSELFLLAQIKQKSNDARRGTFQQLRDLFGNKRADSRDLDSYKPAKVEPAANGGFLVTLQNGNTVEAGKLEGGEWNMFGPNGPVDKDIASLYGKLIEDYNKKGKK